MTNDYLTNIIEREYSKKGISLFKGASGKPCTEPLLQLSPNQEQSLLAGYGHIGKKDEYKQINSSTGLAVNYFKLAEYCGHVQRLSFEDKVAVPLVSANKSANLDVSFYKADHHYFVESKFLEPYYDGVKKNVASYTSDESKYPNEVREHVKEWIDLFKEADSFKIYNVPQLCRHMLAIYRYSYIHNFNEKITLVSVIWKVTETFLNLINEERLKTEINDRLRKLLDEERICHKLLQEFIKKINWKNMSFEAKSYNDEDVISAIKEAKEYKDFTRRYFLG